MSKYTLTVKAKYAWVVADIALLADMISRNNFALGVEKALEGLLDQFVTVAYADAKHNAKRLQAIIENLRSVADEIEQALTETEAEAEEECQPAP